MKTFREGEIIYFYTYHKQDDPFYKGEGVVVHVNVNEFSQIANYEIKPNVKFGNSAETIYRTSSETHCIPQNNEVISRKF
jgi:hypothetical protein